MLFKEIVGQNSIKERLKQAVNTNRISHAQLFLGPEGSGNLALALAYAQYVVCENRTEEDACGVCRSCKQMQKLIHPDVHFAFPVNTAPGVTKDPVSEKFMAKWREAANTNPYMNLNQWYEHIGIENKQGVINKKESEEIIRKLNLKSFESEYKVLIIWMPELMNASAGNMLLKLIEEPPAKTLFLLVGENPDRLLGTILSRTQLVKIVGVERDAIKNHLQELHGLDSETAANYAQVANGNYNKAQMLLQDSGENEYNFTKFQEIMRFSFTNDVPGTLKWVEEIAPNGREKHKNFLNYGIGIIRENLMMNLNQDDLVYLPVNELEWSKKFSPFIHQENVFKIIEELSLAHSHISQNANAKITLTDMALKMMKLINKK